MPWPFGPQVRLLMAAIGPASTAESAFLAWLDEIDIEDHMDGGSFRLLPLAFDRLRALGVEHPLMGRLKGVYRKAWVDTHALFHAAEPALAILAEAGVPTLLLKGAPLALTYYRSHATRPMSDIDLAVPADQAKAAVALLERRGWTARSRFKPHEIPDSHSVEMIGPTGVEVDLHWHPLHETPSADAEAWWWKDARPLRFGEIETLQPRPAVMLLHVVVHGVRPNEEPPIRWIADAATVIRGAGADLDWDDFLAFAGRQKLNCRLHLGLNHLAQEYGVGVPESVLRTLRSRGVSLVERVENLVYLGDYRGEYKPLLWPVADYARFARSQPFGAVLRGFLPYIKRRWRLESARQIPLRALGALGRKLLGTRRSRAPGRRETKPILAEASVAAKAADPGPPSSRGPLGWARLRHRTLFDPAGWRYFGGYFKGRGRPLAAVGALGAAQSAILALTLLLVRYAFNVAAPRGDIRSLVLIGLVLVLARLLASVFTLIARRISLEVVKAAVRRMRRDLIATLYALPREALERHDAADLQTRVVQQTERLDNLASTLASSILPALLTGVFLTAALVYLSWWLTLIMAALAPVMWLLVLVGGRPIQREVTAFQSAFDVFSRGVHFVLRQMQLTRARAFEAEEIDRQDAALLRLEETGVRMAMSYAAHAQIQASVTGVAGLILLIAGGVGVAGRVITMGDLLAFYLAAGLLNGALQKITAVIPEVISGGQSLRDLLSLTAEAAPAPYQGAEPVAAGGRIVLDDVSFGYGGRPVLEGVRLELPARSNTVVIGANGAGKTTLVNLILGYFRPDAGALFVDGAPYDDIDMRAFRRSIGFVPQKPTFFTGTIAENIAYGSPEVRRADIEAAASRAGAGGFLQRLPKGLDTVIGEGGARLSGGEAQRLAIARALVSGPRLLILDEPTNHLDAEAVGEIMRRLTRDPSRPAVLTISHDPAVISFADVVYRLEARVLRLQSAPVAIETAV